MELEELGFQKLSPKERQLFDTYYEKMNGYWPSSLCFLSMNAWNHSIPTYFKVVNEYIMCFAWDITHNRMVMLPFFGEYQQEKINQAMEVAEEYVQKLNIPLIITDISEWAKPYYEAIPNKKWDIVDDRSIADYIYQADDFKNAMNTQEFRYNYQYFLRKYKTETEQMKPEHIEECVEFLKRIWCTVHTCEDCEYGCLKKTVGLLTENIEQLKGKGIIVRSEGRMIAYNVVTYQNGLGIYQFKSTERGFRGINEYLHKECFDRFLSGAKIINYTEDMGLEGLRNYKSRLAPFTLEPKYEFRKVN